MDTAIDVDGGYRFSEEDLELFRSLSTSMFATGVSYLVATSVTAVYYGAAVAVRAPLLPRLACTSSN